MVAVVDLTFVFCSSSAARLLLQIKCYLYFRLLLHLCLLLLISCQGDAIETIAGLGDKSYFGSIIKPDSCYILKNYIAIESRTSMAVFEHNTSLRIGKRATFLPIPECNVPRQYFRIASFDELERRILPPKQLIDYIRYVVRKYPKTTSTGKILKKLDITDVSNNEVTMTIWPEMHHLISDDTKAGDIILVASALVTQYKGITRLIKQLQTTYPTRIFINPSFQQVEDYIKRYTTQPNNKNKRNSLRHLQISSIDIFSIDQAITSVSSQQFVASRIFFVCDI